MLYAAHIAKSADTKEALYVEATKLFPSDPRGFNNAGVMEFAKGNYARAEEYFNKANQLTTL